MSVVELLNRLGIVHFMLNKLGFRYLITWLLHKFPIVKALPNGTRYRIKHVESFILASEVFSSGVYGQAFDGTIGSFIDIGCNIGYFSALVADKTKNKALKGIAIDANPEMCEETRWMTKKNRLSNLHVVNGLVSAPGETTIEEFFVSDSHIISSRFPEGEPGLPQKGKWHKIMVSTVDVEEEWLKAFGDVRCSLAKIDIEGGEKDFLVPGNSFFDRVDAVLLEWHDWIISREEMTNRLESMGFKLVSVLEDLPTRGVGLYRRTS